MSPEDPQEPEEEPVGREPLPLDSELAISKDAPPSGDDIEADDSFGKVFEHGRHMGF